MTDLKLNADPMNVGDLLGKKAIYRVPGYQRQFSWDTPHFDDLWSDILEGIKRDRPHHLNEVKLVPCRDKSPEEFQIIDGQQRLTAVSILIAAMRDEYQRRNLDSKYVEELQNLLQTKDRDANTVRNLRLLNEGDTDDDRQYELIFNGDPESETIDGQIGAAYRFFKRKLKDCSRSRLDDIRGYTIHRLSLIRTVIENMVQAFVMFSTTNSRGLDLSKLEVVKSIVMRIAYREDEDEEKARRLWADVVNIAKDADSGKPRRAIKDVFFVKSAINAAKESSKGGSSEFIDFMRSVFSDRSDGGVNNRLEWLVEMLKDYSQIKNAHVSRYNERHNGHINSLIRQFNSKNPHSGIILYWLFDNLDDPAELIEALDWAAKLALRLYLADKTAGKRRSAIHGAVTNLENGMSPKRAFKEQMREYTPADRALHIQLKDRLFKRCETIKYVLYRVEVDHYAGTIGGTRYPTGGEDIELEHIAPMRTFSADKYSRWREVVDNNETRFENERKRLGNLTLLRSRQNQAAGAEPFKNKCEKYRTSEFRMSKKIPEEHSGWGFGQINARTRSLAKLTVQTFSADGYDQSRTAVRGSDADESLSRLQDFQRRASE